jgi:hypothetical protein
MSLKKSSVVMEQIIPGGKDFYDKRDKLKLVKKSGWEIYYIDETTGEKWIEEYLHGEMHGGGPPQLRLLHKFPWE